jgi:hypothetical protein
LLPFPFSSLLCLGALKSQAAAKELRLATEDESMVSMSFWPMHMVVHNMSRGMQDMSMSLQQLQQPYMDMHAGAHMDIIITLGLYFKKLKSVYCRGLDETPASQAQCSQPSEGEFVGHLYGHI